MSTGVGIQAYKVWEQPLVDPYWAAHGGVGPGQLGGPGAGETDYPHQFPDNTGVAAGTGWTYDAHYKCWRIAATPGSNSDLAITLPSPPTYTLGHVGRLRLNVLECSVANAIELRWAGTNPALIAAITAPGMYDAEYTLPGGGSGGVWVVRAKISVAVVAAIKSISWTRPHQSRRIWLAANTGDCT